MSEYNPGDVVVNEKGLIAWWAKNGIAANLLMIVAFIGGIVGFNSMERMVFPSADFNGLQISVSWPGAAPQEVEEQIILRMEEAIADMEGIERLTATAGEGFGSISVEAERSVDMDDFVDEVKRRVDAVNNLPPSSFRPQVQQWSSTQPYMGMALHGNIDLVQLKRLADDVREEVARLPGAARTVVWATLPEEVAIEITEAALLRYDLTFDEVARAIRNSSMNTSAGSVRTDVGDVSLGSRNLAETAAEFENIIIRQTQDGAIVRVRDVATVIDGFVDANLESSFDNEPMALVAVLTLQEKMNVVETQKAVKEYIEQKNLELPPGVELTMWWDDSKAYFGRMKTITTSAAIGLVLVFIVLILFLRPVVAFWCTVGIAVAFAGTFAILPAVGVSLNMLSLFAFLLVIGIIVDDAIIVGENIHNQVERGEKGVNAAILGTQLVAKPVVFAVITSMMAFAPWMMLSGPEVQFTRQISLVVIAALSFSLIESLFILPNHLSHMKPQRFDGPFGGFLRFQRRVADALIWFARRMYRPVAEMAVRGRYVTVTLFAGLFIFFIAAWQVGGWVKFNFMPEVEGEYLQVTIDMPDGTPFARVQQIKSQLEDAEERFMEAMNEEYGDAGNREVKVVESISAIASDGQIQAWIGLVPPEARPEGLSMKDVADRLREELGPIPDAEEVRLDFTFNNNDGGVRFALQAKDGDLLSTAAEELKTQLSSYDAVFEVRDNMQSAADEARINLLPGAQATGLTLADVTRQVRQAFYGEEVQRLPRDGDDVRVMVRYPKDARESLDAFRNFRIRTSDGRDVPLASIAEVEFAPGVSRIQRRERQRAIFVTADVKGDAAIEIRRDLDENFFPEWQRRHPSVSRDLIGNAEGEQEFMAEILRLQLIVLLGMYILLAVAFRSIFQPLLVMTAIPFAMTGAIIGHILMGTPLALFSFFGIGAAAGVVINDNLVLIDYVNRLRAAGVGAFQALIEAGTARFRPILLTSVTTFIGVLPMIGARSTQAQFLKPMVISLGFAVVFALFLTLFLVPSLYAVGVDVARFFKWVFKGQPYEGIGSRYDPHATLAGPMGVVAEGDADAAGAAPRPTPAE